jgi:cytochrome b6-f complex iron-sulfur subunit
MDPVTPTRTTTEPAGMPSRRTVLVAGIAVAGTAGLAAVAGCSAKSAAAQSTSTGSGVLATVASIPVGNAVSATLDGKPILISQPVAGQIVAFTAICTHQGCTVAPAGKEFKCPCHGSVYNAATGAVIMGPAPAPLAAISVKVQAGNVVAG